MKPTVADYQTRIFALRIESTNGSDIVRFVDYPHDLAMGGETYKTDSGYQFTDYSSTNSGSPSLLDLEGILLASGISRSSIISGVWDNAIVSVFATSWTNPTEDEEQIARFTLGKSQLIDDRYVIEMMHLVDALNQQAGLSHSPLCSNEFCDENLDGETFSDSKCGLTLADNTDSGTITGVTSNRIFQDTALVSTDDYYAMGEIRFTSGNNYNAGVRAAKISAYADDGTITLFDGLPLAVEVGDNFDITVGCRKRLQEDCKTKHNNVRNANSGGFRGFPHIITQSQYQKIGGQGR